MNALQVSSQEIQFRYSSKGHLQATLTIKNNNDQHSYFKFKVTRPKYYLIKPDHGFCDAKSSVNIIVTLHQQGVNQGQNDKLKLYYKFLGQGRLEPTKGWEKQQIQAYSIRFPITIQGLPQQYKRQADRGKNSEVKSLANSKFDQVQTSNIPALESSIKQKQNRLNHLKSEVDLLRKGASKSQKASSQGGKYYFLVAAIGLVIGFATSFWL